jgi:hypothetical protein
LSIVGSIVLCPLLAIHSAVDALRLILVAQNINNDLVANSGLASGRRMTAVIGSLSGAGSGASLCAGSVGLDGGEGEEFIAHVGVLVRDGVKRSVNCTTEFDGAAEAGLRWWSGVLVVAV